MISFPHFLEAAVAAANLLVASVWQAAVLTLMVALILRQLPGLTAAARSAVWTVVLLLVFLLPVLSSLGASHHVALPAAQARNHALHLSPNLALALGVVWAVLAMWRLSQLAHGAHRLRSMVRHAHQVKPDSGIACLLRGGAHEVTLYSSAEVNRPSALGFFRPCILLPAELLERLSESELEQVILHELQHLHRRDQWTNLLQKLAIAVFPLNPVLLWIDQKLCFERELACDDGVLRFTQARRAYAECLLHLADQSILQRGVALALRAWDRPSELARRVHRILDPQQAFGTGKMIVVTGLILVGILGGTVTLSRAPRLVSFAYPAAQLSASESLPVTNLMAAPRRFAPPVLVKFTESSQQETNPLPAGKRPTRSARRKLLRNANAPSQQRIASTAWYLTTAWPAGTSRARLAIAYTHASVSYAAVATRDGWLIFQL